MDKTLREKMIEKGASNQQLQSRTLEMVEEIIAEDAGIVSDEAIRFARKINNNLVDAKRELYTLDNRINSIKNDARQCESIVKEVKGSISEFAEAHADKMLQDPKTRDAFALYNYVLESTLEVFGEENMTEAVMIKAIEAGSFGLWRSIMGGKFDDTLSRNTRRN